MRRSVLASVLSLTLVAAACTDGADEPESVDAGEVVAEQPDDAASEAEPEEPAGPRAASFTSTLTELSLDVDGLAGAEPVEEAFAPSALEVVGTSFHAFGQLATPDGASMPAVYRSSLADGRTWERIDLDLPEDIASGSTGLVDAPDVSVLRLRDERDHSRVEVRRRTDDPDLVAVIDDADLVAVHNVASDGDGYLAVGTRHDGETRRPALWSIQDGEVSAVELPDDERVQRDRVGLDAAVVRDGRYLIAGSDDEADALIWLEGPAVDELEVVEAPDGLEEAYRVSTMLVADDVLWLGGAEAGAVYGQLAIWSQASPGASFHDRTDAVWEHRETFTSSASRLVPGTWPSGDPYVAVVEGAYTLWWTTQGSQVTETGVFGGTLAAYSNTHDTAVTYDGQNGTFSVGFEEADVSLAPPLWVQDVPHIGFAGADVVTLHTGANEAARTMLVEPSGERIGEAVGNLGWDQHAGLQTLTGAWRDSDIVPVAARVVDGEVLPVELTFEGESTTARATTTLTDGTEDLIVGHRFLDGGVAAPLAWTLAGTDATLTDRLDDVLGARGFAGGCGPATAITFDEVQRIGVAWPFAADGPTEVLIEEGMRSATTGSCVESSDGTVWLLGEQLLLAVSEDGTIAEHPQPQVRSPLGLHVVEVDDAHHLIALVGDEGTAAGTRLWTAPLDDPSLATLTDRLELPAEVGRPSVVGFDETTMTYTLASRVGTAYRTFELELDPT